jgi:hypothetical protein
LGWNRAGYRQCDEFEVPISLGGNFIIGTSNSKAALEDLEMLVEFWI